jgi:hypothetical protein
MKQKKLLVISLYLVKFIFINIKADIYTFKPEFFTQDAVSTELTAYQLISNHPLKNNINYVAFPWAVLINKNLLHTVPEINVENGYTVCQHIRYEKIIPILKKMGVKVLFTPHVDKDYDGITVLPFPHLAINGINPSNITKDICASFVGAEYTHHTRAQIFKLFAHDPRFVLLNRGNTWHFNLKPQLLDYYTQEYQDILVRSRFALCPRGTGASTIRFWESLQAGAVPVLIADAMRLPDSFDWDKCIIKIKESDLNTIPTILDSISPEQELNMRSQCLIAYHKFANANFISPIINYYQKKELAHEAE